MTPESAKRQGKALLQDYAKVPRSVVEDLLCAGAELPDAQASGYLRALSQIVKKGRLARRTTED